MISRVLIDTNVVLDVLLAREPWVTHSKSVWSLVDEGVLLGFLCASAVTDIFYVATRLTNHELAREAVAVCLRTFEIAPVDRGILEGASLLEGADFEDNVQLMCAVAHRLDGIVTRDAKGFPSKTVMVWSPEEFVKALG